MITLITTTGWRHAGFALCEKYIARQTYKGDIQWIVVGDDKLDSPTPCNMGQEYYPGPKVWSPGINTQRYNLDLAYSKINPKTEAVFIIEDDDHYKPQYLEVMMGLFKHADLVGECGVTYYSLKTRGFMEMKNFQHASLCQTAFRYSYLAHFYRAIHSGNEFIDIILWNRARAANHKYLLLSGLNLLTGMKGVPGRAGIGVGHQDNNFTADQHFVKLKQLIGPEDAKVYIDMVK